MPGVVRTRSSSGPAVRVALDPLGGVVQSPQRYVWKEKEESDENPFAGGGEGVS